MNIIFAKHDALNKEYLFEVPEGMHPVKGDVLWVNTSKGETVAIATSDMISGSGVDQIADKFGAYFPLKKVLAYANRGIETYRGVMDYKEALDILDKTFIGNLEAKVLITKAVKKQIETKVTHEASLYRCCTCPSCGNVVDKFEKFGDSTVRVEYPHCHFCGQALDYSDERRR